MSRPNHIQFLSSSDEDEPPVKKSIFDSAKKSENNSKPKPKHIVFVDSSDDEKEPSVSKLRFDSTIDYESKSVKKKKNRSRDKPPIDSIVERSRSDSTKKSKKNSDEKEESPTKEVSRIDLIVMKSNFDSTKKNKKKSDQNRNSSVDEASPIDTVVHKSIYDSTKMSEEYISDQKNETCIDEVSHVESVVKRSRSDSTNSDGKNSSNDIERNEESSSEDITQMEIGKKIRQVQKRNERPIKCLICKEYKAFVVTTFLTHLNVKHSTNLGLAGLFLRCDCGHESQSNMHLFKCKIGNYTLIRKKEGPIQTFHDKVTPQCIMCETYPRTAKGYAGHLVSHHTTTLIACRRYLICSCGMKVTCNFVDPSHKNKCDGRRFTLHSFEQE